MMMEASAIPLLMLMITLVVHLVVTVWWAASLTKRVDHIERWISSNEHTAARLAALEQQMNDVSRGIARIEHYLTKV